MLILSSWMLACGGLDCAAMSPGLERDRCLGSDLKELPPGAWERALQIAEGIGDPVVRGEAVFFFAEQSAGQVPPQGIQSLCGVLEAIEARICTRRLSAAHLQR